MNLLLPVICNNFDATTKNTLASHFSAYLVSRGRRPRPSINELRSAAVGSLCVQRRVSHNIWRSLTATTEGLCVTPTPTRRYFPCRRYPMQGQLETLVYL